MSPSKKTAAKKQIAKPGRPNRAVSKDLAPERIAAILKGLDEAYPNAVCALNHKTPWELLWSEGGTCAPLTRVATRHRCEIGVVE